MSGAILTAATIASAAGAGVSGGVYLAFSAIVMPALRGLPAGQRVASMQLVNANAVRLPFMTVFFGGAAASVALVVAELDSETAAPGAAQRLVGAGFHSPPSASPSCATSR